jgi:DNA-binding MarR family transcriptional regulator
LRISTLVQAALISIHRQAKFMEMDRTTLTRNLGLLMKQHLVGFEEGEDRRMHLVLLTGEGEQALGRAWPLWQEAQARIERAFGQERFDELLTELSAVRAVARESLSDIHAILPSGTCFL